MANVRSHVLQTDDHPAPSLHTPPSLSVEEGRLPHILHRQLAASPHLPTGGEHPSKGVYFGSHQQKPDFIKKMLGLFASLLWWEFLMAIRHKCHFSAKSNIYVISRQRTLETPVIYHSSFHSMAQAGQTAQPFVTFPSPTSQVQGQATFAGSEQGPGQRPNQCGRNLPLWCFAESRILETLKL